MKTWWRSRARLERCPTSKDRRRHRVVWRRQGRADCTTARSLDRVTLNCTNTGSFTCVSIFGCSIVKECTRPASMYALCNAFVINPFHALIDLPQDVAQHGCRHKLLTCEYMDHRRRQLGEFGPHQLSVSKTFTSESDVKYFRSLLSGVKYIRPDPYV